jgi:hypothetical protein
VRIVRQGYWSVGEKCNRIDNKAEIFDEPIMLKTIVSLMISMEMFAFSNMSIICGSGEYYAKQMKRTTAWILQYSMVGYIAKTRRPNEGRNNERPDSRRVACYTGKMK